MKISRITAEGFLSFAEFSVDLGQGLTVVTGPNAAGKSNICQVLAAVSAFLRRHRDQDQRDLLSLYEQAGHHGAPAFTLTVSFELDQPWEQKLVTDFVKASYISIACMKYDGMGPSTADVEEAAETCITTDSVAALFHGTLRLDFDSHRRSGWSCAWQFHHNEEPFYVQVEGPFHGQLRPGVAQGWKTVAMEQVTDAPPPELVDFPVILKELEQPVAFSVPSLHDSPRPVSMVALDEALGLTEQNSVPFVAVLGKIWAAGVSVTANRRLPARRLFSIDELTRPLDLSDGSCTSAELYRLKNGARDQRERFLRAKEVFRAVTGACLEVEASPGTGGMMGIDVVIDTGRGERRAEFSGAGLQEVVLLAALIAGQPGRVIVLDEPAVHLHPTKQRQIARTALRDVQALLITHSADLVPAATADDLKRIVRLAPGPDGATTVRRAPATALAGLADWLQNLAVADTRALLFAQAVILCEGATETGALGHWWNTDTQLGPEAANIPLLDVGGDNNFGGFINYLNAFGIPWAVIADGPALRNNSGLARQLTKQGLRPLNPPDDVDDFCAWRDYWQTAGVFTLADQFGGGGSKSGELEAYLERLDPLLVAQVAKETSSKPRRGAVFAARYPHGIPPEVDALYKDVATHLKLA